MGCCNCNALTGTDSGNVTRTGSIEKDDDDDERRGAATAAAAALDVTRKGNSAASLLCDGDVSWDIDMRGTSCTASSTISCCRTMEDAIKSCKRWTKMV